MSRTIAIKAFWCGSRKDFENLSFESYAKTLFNRETERSVSVDTIEMIFSTVVSDHKKLRPVTHISLRDDTVILTRERKPSLMRRLAEFGLKHKTLNVTTFIASEDPSGADQLAQNCDIRKDAENVE